MNGEIYIIKNDINNKVYIGQTTQGSKTRFKQHLKLLKTNSKQLIHKAIKKYGKEHFYFEVLEKDISVENLDEREEYWIKYFDSVNFGYNLCWGGKQSRKISKFKDMLMEFKEEIIDRYINDNVSIRELEREFGIPHSNISKFLKENNIDVCKRNKETSNLTEEEKLLIADMYKNNFDTKYIANMLNRHESTVRRYRKYKYCV